MNTDKNPGSSFSHVALLYAGEDEFVERTGPFVRAGLDSGEPVLVAASQRKCRRLASDLGDPAEGVEYVDMAEVGRNPACILPVWLSFAERNRGRSMRGIGEPVGPERSASELDECEHHESLLNLAFEDGPDLTLLCPYDTATLAPDALEAARRTHPCIRENGRDIASDTYLPPDQAPGPFAGPLPPVAPDAAEFAFGNGDADLAAMRDFVLEWAGRAGLEAARADDLTLAVHELAANSLRHGGGGGTLRAWRENGAVHCEVSDGGEIRERLAGRLRPGIEALSGRGLWLVNHLCDLVQIRSLPEGNLVRVRMDVARD